MTILRARNIRKRFGGVVALEQGDLALGAGEVHVLIGSNGCGKSTLCKIIGGSVAPDGGSLELSSEPVRFRTPHAAAAAGIGVFYQELSLIPQLTVAENIFLGREPRTAYGLVDRKRLRSDAETAIRPFGAVVGQGFGPDVLVSDLSADQRQIVEILKVLSENSRIVIFDEATASLDSKQVAVFFDLIRSLKAEDHAIIFISHRMDEVFAIGDRVTVMRNGRTVVSVAIAETTQDEIVAHMVGGAYIAAADRKEAPAPLTGTAVLAARNLVGRKLADVSFSLQRGEILGLGGLHGQGQSDLLRSLFGAESLAGGSVFLDGKPLLLRKPSDAIANGIAYISGDRSRYGVLPIRSIFENLVIGLVSKQRPVGLNYGALVKRIAPVAERLKLKFPSFAAPVSDLSGGNQQKVVIGRWLAVAPAVLLLDDPTKGIDLQTKHDLYVILRELCAEGVSIILYSSEDKELLGNADRILVFNGGRIVRELEGERMGEFELYQAAYAAS
ncbi:sugar ABC transporter ATP-binding protein [Rhodospirillaceae bacterium SYSU D60014]|uniref:sugar ABC transporter ATP-binding protein n=1 Tax=Virgifigura deserti TaxID=2268457 RepID=UPI000E66CFE6